MKDSGLLSATMFIDKLVLCQAPLSYRAQQRQTNDEPLLVRAWQRMTKLGTTYLSFFRSNSHHSFLSSHHRSPLLRVRPYIVGL